MLIIAAVRRRRIAKFSLAHGTIRISDSCAPASSSFCGEITRRENIAIVSVGAHSFPAEPRVPGTAGNVIVARHYDALL